jgi:hypothetical protein
MANREIFTPEEWEALKETPLLAGMFMVATSPQGVLGAIKELTALYVAHEQMLNHGAYYELIDALRADQGTQQKRLTILSEEHFHSIDQVRKSTLDHCRLVTQTLFQKASEEEAGYYRRGLLWLCLQVAQAAREGGGFLGVNSVKFTEEEQQALRQIAFALGIPAHEAIIEALPETPQRAVPRTMAGLFSSQEWELLRQAPVWVSAAITAASPSGTMGIIKELNALALAIQKVVVRYPSNRLIAALLDDMSLITHQSQPVADITDQMSAQDAAGRAVDLCRQAAELVEHKASAQEAREYKEMVLFLANQIAESAKEGGVFGLGSRRITDQELNLLQQISRALRIDH